MPPTLKDSFALPTSSEGSERTAPGAADASNTQPIALEVPVTVNSAKAPEGSEKREPFSETTTTVLILANGAVLRLSTSVEPGQRLSLTNEKTKKEILCQVVKSKSARTASGYVEVEFTQPVQGFWGTRFPNERNAAQVPTSLAASARKLDPDPSVSGIPTISSVPKSTTFTDAPPSALEFNSNLADPVQDLKTEIKADSRSSSKADFFAPAETPVGAPKLESNRLQEQLSALLAAEQQQIESPAPAKVELADTAAKILDIAAEAPAAKVPAPPKSDAALAPTSTPATSSFDSEKVQIPAWLEPLARNAAISAPPAELAASDSTDQFDEFEAAKPAPPVPDHKPAKAAPKASPSLPAHAPAAPLFGKTLLDHSTSALAKPSGSNKGLWMTVAAALLLSAASGAWYFRDELASLAAQRLNSPARSSAIPPANASLLPAPIHEAPLTTPSAPAPSTPDTLASAASKSSNERTPAAQPTSNSSSSQGRMETAAITERIPKANSSNDSSGAEANSIEIVEPEVRKSLGKVRLAKPKVRHSATSQGNGEMAPSLDSGNEGSEDQNPLSANLANSSNQPAAPVAVGGDVTPARMISSVPPVYPAMAKTQHISGDVRVDALIDASGRVTTMKVISGPSLLHQAAKDALRQWKYQPASLDGKPASMHLTVTIQFRLQ